MYTRVDGANIFYSFYSPKTGKNGKSSFIPYHVEIAGNACFNRVGTAGLEPATSAM